MMGEAQHAGNIKYCFVLDQLAAEFEPHQFVGIRAIDNDNIILDHKSSKRVELSRSLALLIVVMYKIPIRIQSDERLSIANKQGTVRRHFDITRALKKEIPALIRNLQFFLKLQNTPLIRILRLGRIFDKLLRKRKGTADSQQDKKKRKFPQLSLLNTFPLFVSVYEFPIYPV